MGVANPDKIIDGVKNKKTPNNPCCCVVASDEIISPIPIAANIKTNIPNVSANKLPKNGILNQNKANVDITIPSAIEIINAGKDFPIKILSGVMGVTNN